MRAQAFPLRFSASAQGLGSYRHPPPPNNSFKPTPCRGIGHVLYATLAHVRRPATGRLNSGVRRYSMKISRTDLSFIAVALLGLLFSIFPDFVISPASYAWRALTGGIDLFGVREYLSWLGLLAILLTCTIGRAIFLLTRPSKTTGAHVVFYILTVSLIVAVALAIASRNV